MARHHGKIGGATAAVAGSRGKTKTPKAEEEQREAGRLPDGSGAIQGCTRAAHNLQREQGLSRWMQHPQHHGSPPPGTRKYGQSKSIGIAGRGFGITPQSGRTMFLLPSQRLADGVVSPYAKLSQQSADWQDSPA